MDKGVPPSGSGHSPKGGAAKASPAKPSVPNAADIPEAAWIADMRAHFVEHGFYRWADLERLLGRPGQSVHIGADGKVAVRG